MHSVSIWSCYESRWSWEFPGNTGCKAGEFSRDRTRVLLSLSLYIYVYTHISDWCISIVWGSGRNCLLESVLFLWEVKWSQCLCSLFWPCSSSSSRFLLLLDKREVLDPNIKIIHVAKLRRKGHRTPFLYGGKSRRWCRSNGSVRYEEC